MPLLLADRVNMLEGVVDDLWSGHVPNILAEAGWHAEWKYNRTQLPGRILLGAAIAGGIVGLIAARRARDDSDSHC